ncbi:NAD(+) kinase [Flocculibacter collagenilyticus]|uniref:NAD(+) kinase n=1 Tax=Flocculibacter collagenilyticus TaxID=2744479 RepID=UPI0018F313D5|nr:NAD(+) kinase [Flocculibacter collagenilyticus]
MTSAFKHIALIGKPNHKGTTKSITQLYQFLTELEYQVSIEKRSSQQLQLNDIATLDLVEIGEQCDLAIVVGGDGNMLGAARVLARFDVAVIGVNRGNLGFLTDLDPHTFQEPLKKVLAGEYIEENRFLLDVSVHRHQTIKSSNTAVNEAVLHADKVAHMIEFEVHIDNEFVYSQRSDGLIVATPTGSTAYSLSGGGPIVHPSLQTLSLVPMFPHTLSSRPLVVSANSEVKLLISLENDESLQISCDSHVTLSVMPGDEVIIKKCDLPLRLIHPKNYSYYKVLRSKLGWGARLV